MIALIVLIFRLISSRSRGGQESGKGRGLPAKRRVSPPDHRHAWEADTLPAELLPLGSRPPQGPPFGRSLPWIAVGREATAVSNVAAVHAFLDLGVDELVVAFAQKGPEELVVAIERFDRDVVSALVG